MNRRLLLASSLLLPAGLFAQTVGETPMRKYAVVSLIGDKMSVIVYQPQTGSSLDTNRHESIPLDDAFLDNAALSAAERAITASDKNASAVLLKVTSATIYDQQKGLLDGSKLVIPNELSSPLTEVQATHLVLITKYRADARLQTQNGGIGSGKLEGIGYYVDQTYRMSRSDTGERGFGFLAPFVYIRISLFDLKSLNLIGDKTVTASTTLSSARNKQGMDAWSTLTPMQKVDRLRRMVAHEVLRVVPLLLAGGMAGEGK